MQRLQHRQQFDAVLAGATVARTPHFALHRCALDSTGSGSEGSQALFAVRAPWIGALIPKRWAKRAVTRNTIRRQIYAVASEFASLPEAAHVVRLRSGVDRQAFPSASSLALKQALRAELKALFSGARS